MELQVEEHPLRLLLGFVQVYFAELESVDWRIILEEE
jgi:hypothetical protein